MHWAQEEDLTLLSNPPAKRGGRVKKPFPLEGKTANGRDPLQKQEYDENWARGRKQLGLLLPSRKRDLWVSGQAVVKGRWSGSETAYLLACWDNPAYLIARHLGRTVDAVKDRKSILKARGLAPDQQKESTP